MLKISFEYIDQLESATTLEDLHSLVQKAIELEHSTIPPYLTALMSLKPGQNREIAGVIHSVVLEEMLHMCIAANLLNALGGSPIINHPDFIPRYPGPLPMGIGQGLVVGLAPYSVTVVKKIFMEIEEPETPLVFPVKKMTTEHEAIEYKTIGDFYNKLIEKISQLAKDELPGKAHKQLTGMFSKSELFPIITKHDAIKAIKIIVEQGEGTTTSPLDNDGDLAHYYRFSELVHGKSLVKDHTVKEGFSYSGSPIPFDPSGVYPLTEDTKVEDLPTDTEAHAKALEFNSAYSRLLNGLHKTFNGEPEFFPNTLGLMYDVKLIGETLAKIPHPKYPGKTVGPPFQFAIVSM